MKEAGSVGHAARLLSLGTCKDIAGTQLKRLTARRWLDKHGIALCPIEYSCTPARQEWLARPRDWIRVPHGLEQHCRPQAVSSTKSAHCF
eukprot:scaffold13227_cov117-Isochrysis_galbana.AAC.20